MNENNKKSESSKEYLTQEDVKGYYKKEIDPKEITRMVEMELINDNYELERELQEDKIRSDYDLTQYEEDEEEIEELKETLEELENEKEELETQETNEGYDEMLEETKENWIKYYNGGHVLKEVDPTAYRCGLNDYNDERLTELEDEIQEKREEIKELEIEEEEEEEEIRYKPEDKPELEGVKEIIPDTEDFVNPDKAEAIIKNLNLSSADTIQEDENGEEYIINPVYVLEGTSPEEYKTTVDNLKKLLTKEEIEILHKAIVKRTKSYNETVYNRITKKLDSYFWRGNIRKTVLEEIKEVLEFFESGTHTLHNTVYHLLSKDNDDYLICYRSAWFDRPIPDQREWNCRNDGEYRVLTDSEADNSFDDYFEDDELWKQAVESGNTTLSRDDWVEQIKNIEGRGNTLSCYDGVEEYEKVNNVDYYIYRTN